MTAFDRGSYVLCDGDRVNKGRMIVVGVAADELKYIIRSERGSDFII